MKVLLAVDGSACSDAAVDEVARRPWQSGTEFKVVSAAEPPVLPSPETWVLPAGYFEEAEEALRVRAQRAVDDAADRLRRSGFAGLTITTEVLPGFPKQVVVEAAERWGADLIVLGSHGHRGLKRLWLGSVSHAVASHARCSVEIVRCRQMTQSSGD